MSFGQDDVWTNPVNDATRGFRGGRGPDPSPWKITNSIGLYRNMQLDPLPLEKVRPPGNVEPSFSMEYRKVFFEKAIITGLLLQNKLATYNKKKKNEEKTTSELFSVSRAWTPPPNPDENAMLQLNRVRKVSKGAKIRNRYNRVKRYSATQMVWKCLWIISLNEPLHEISNNVVGATSRASDQHAHTRSLI